MTIYIEVALPIPVFHTFTYRCEAPAPAPGTRVLVPFRRGEQIGWVVRSGDPSGLKGIRDVLDVVEREPSVPSELLAVAEWMSSYYVAPLGVVLRSMVPSALSDRSREVLQITEAGRAAVVGASSSGESLSKTERSFLAGLSGGSGHRAVSSLRRALGGGLAWREVRRLATVGLVEHRILSPSRPSVKTRKVVRLKCWITDLSTRQELFARSPRQQQCYEFLEASGGVGELVMLARSEGFSRGVIAGLEDKQLVSIDEEEVFRDPFRGSAPPPPVDHSLSAAQQTAVEVLIATSVAPQPPTFLLHGVTGSGKTLVYIQLLREIVGRNGRGAIVLVPEISLTPQTVGRFRSWFGDEVAVLHSGLSDGERYDQWRQIRSGEKRVVVGARSALFAPLRDLGAIVVDEEHDGSYKQSETPRYHARDVAVVRARLSGAVCVLGSVTPSLESWRNAQEGKFRILSLPERVGGRPMPPVEIVDLRTAWPAPKGRSAQDGGGVLSPRLVVAVRRRLEKDEQAILLLNRRGYASFVQCRACGEVRVCPNCTVSLTFHRTRNRLLCHHCRHEEARPRRCHACGDVDLFFRGLGTEQVEQSVTEAFPSARIARMDVDTTSGKWAHQEILGRVERGEVDLLLGTQMIAKGLDFPRVTLVGVINADVGIHLPDFRASERAFQLLSQVAGRTGRGSLGGDVIIQTYLPGHYAIRSAVDHDMVGFARRELEERRNPRYPPHVRLVNIVVSSPDPQLAATGVEAAAAWTRVEAQELTSPIPELVGPAPAPIERLHGRWRWHFFLRGGRVRDVTVLLRGLLEDFCPPSGDLRIAVDRDPVALL
jgi:primosomal protein N' (replication factor Y)